MRTIEDDPDMREFDGRGEHWQTRSGDIPTSSPPSRKDLAESAGYRVTPADQEPKLAAQCVRMARFLETQHATLDAKVEALGRRRRVERRRYVGLDRQRNHRPGPRRRERLPMSDWKPRPATVAKIEAARAVIEEAGEGGYRLTLRSVFYRMVARNAIPNTLRAYKNLSVTLDKARWAGLLPYGCIDDLERPTVTARTWADVGDALRDAARTYRSAWWNGAIPTVEVWSEKRAVAGIVEPLALRYGVPFLACRGFPSLTCLAEAAERFAARPGGTVIIYCGDHDPSGLDMDRDSLQRLKRFGADVAWHRVALTLAQVAEHNLPPQPTKATDSRAAGYGNDGSWELDALPAAVLADVVEGAIRDRLPPDFDARRREDESARDRLWSMAANA